MLLTATGWGRVTRRRRRRRGRVAWVRGLGRPPAGSRVQRSPVRVSGVLGAMCGEVLVAGFTVFVDRADGEGSVPEAAVLLAATCGDVRGLSSCLAPQGSLGPRKDILVKMTLRLTLFGELRIPTPHAVCGMTMPYISRTVFVIAVCRQLLFPIIILCPQRMGSD